MKIIKNDLQNRAIEGLNACLSEIPFLKVEDISRGTGSEAVNPDLLVKLALPEGEKYLVVEFKSNGQPRFAREAINQILRYGELLPRSYGVFMAPYISAQAAEICRKEGVGYIDLAGNCRMSFGQVYIEKGGNPNPFSEKRDLRSLYSPKAERILRVLLANPKKTWKVAGLANEAQVSFGQVSNVRKLLMDREWVEASRAGIFLRQPEQLLKEWEKNYSFRRNRVQDFYTLISTAEIETALGDLCARKRVAYALTGFSAAARLAPAVRYQRATAYTEKLDDDLVSTLGLRSVTSGANLSIFTPYDEGVFYGARYIDNVRVASPVQAYLDLRGFRGRGEEAAQILLDEVIRSTW